MAKYRGRLGSQKIYEMIQVKCEGGRPLALSYDDVYLELEGEYSLDELRTIYESWRGFHDSDAKSALEAKFQARRRYCNNYEGAEPIILTRDEQITLAWYIIDDEGHRTLESFSRRFCAMTNLAPSAPQNLLYTLRDRESLELRKALGIKVREKDLAGRDSEVGYEVTM